MEKRTTWLDLQLKRAAEEKKTVNRLFELDNKLKIMAFI